VILLLNTNSCRNHWDVRSKEYTRRDKKNAAYEQLLTIYKGLKCDASNDDVKKKN